MPSWCYEKGTQITPDCSIDQDRVEYYTTKLLTFQMWPAYFLSWGCQTFLVLNLLANIAFAKQKSYIFRALILLGLLSADITSGLFFMWNIWKSGLNVYYKIAFIIVYSQTLRNGMIKMLNGIKDSFVVLLIYLVNILVFSGITYVLFFGKSRLTQISQTTMMEKYTLPTIFLPSKTPCTACTVFKHLQTILTCSLRSIRKTN